jgi:hypothetical protein
MGTEGAERVRGRRERSEWAKREHAWDRAVEGQLSGTKHDTNTTALWDDRNPTPNTTLRDIAALWDEAW